MSTPRLPRLYQFIQEEFSLDDIRAICENLYIDYENLSGDNKRVKAIELVKVAAREAQLFELFLELLAERGHLSLAPYLHELAAVQFDTPAILTLIQELGGQVNTRYLSSKPAGLAAQYLQETADKLNKRRQVLTALHRQAAFPLDELELLFIEAAPAAAVLPAAAEADVSTAPVIDDHFYHLNYIDQIDAFDLCYQQQPVAAICLHTETEGTHSMRLLLRCLLRVVPKNQQIIRIPIEQTLVTGISADSLWYDFAGQMQVDVTGASMGDEATHQKVVQAVVNSLQSTHVVLLAQGLSPAQSKTLLEKFWQPLVEYVQAQLAGQIPPYRLLLLWVDDEGIVIRQIAPAENGETAVELQPYPFTLLPVNPFSEDDFLRWIRDGRRVGQLDEGIRRFVKRSDVTPQELARNIFEKSNQGVPDRALMFICQACEIDWHGRFRPWLYA